MKPFLFLDVDGVLNASPPIEGHQVTRKLGFPICIPPGTKERIASLVEVFEPVWATTWRGDAHPNFAAELDLTSAPPWPYIKFRDLKILSILDYVVSVHMSGTSVRRWVWIDDDAPWEIDHLGLVPDGRKSLAIAPETGVGLTDEHVAQALAFAGSGNA
jgi:hypothetical protein